MKSSSIAALVTLGLLSAQTAPAQVHLTMQEHEANLAHANVIVDAERTALRWNTVALASVSAGGAAVCAGVLAAQPLVLFGGLAAVGFGTVCGFYVQAKTAKIRTAQQWFVDHVGDAGLAGWYLTTARTGVDVARAADTLPPPSLGVVGSSRPQPRYVSTGVAR